MQTDATGLARTLTHQWQTRPNEERFETLETLRDHCAERASRSRSLPTNTRRIVPQVQGEGEDQRLVLELAGEGIVEPTHWSFGQLCTAAKTPANYLRQPGVAAGWAVQAVDYGLRFLAKREDQLAYVEGNGNGDGVRQLRAMTSTSYARIYDHAVVEMVQNVADPDVWKPKAHDYSGDEGTKKASTLYASDRDLTIWLVDSATDPVEMVDPRTNRHHALSRGFVVRGSEVGSKAFDISTFWWNDTCSNRLLWQGFDLKTMRIVHIHNAIDRFQNEGAAMLEEFVTADPAEAIGKMQRALEIEVGRDRESVTDWLRKNGNFTARTANQAYTAAENEEGECTTLWHVVQGGTAIARQIPHQDDRMDVERRFGRLLQLAA